MTAVARGRGRGRRRRRRRRRRKRVVAAPRGVRRQTERIARFCSDVRGLVPSYPKCRTYVRTCDGGGGTLLFLTRECCGRRERRERRNIERYERATTARRRRRRRWRSRGSERGSKRNRVGKRWHTRCREKWRRRFARWRSRLCQTMDSPRQSTTNRSRSISITTRRASASSLSQVRTRLEISRGRPRPRRACTVSATRLIDHAIAAHPGDITTLASTAFFLSPLGKIAPSRLAAPADIPLRLGDREKSPVETRKILLTRVFSFISLSFLSLFIFRRLKHLDEEMIGPVLSLACY